MEYRIARRIPDEAARFLRETYSMDLRPLSKGYIYLYLMGERGLRDVWMISSHPMLDKLDLKLFKRVGFRMLRLDGKYLIPSNTFIQVFGGYMDSNIVIINDKKLLKRLLQQTYIILGRDLSSIEEIRHTDYPYKVLKYNDVLVGIVKKHEKGYISLLPKKYSDVNIL